MFAKETIKFLFLKFIHKPTVNAIKDDTFNACINIKNIKDNKSNILEGECNIFEGKWKMKIKELEDKLKDPDNTPGRLVRALLLVHAYLNENQNKLLPNKKLHIEHILPKKWQNANYRGWSEEDAQDYLERFGNKVICENMINIRAGNEYFKEKRKRYQKSDIANVKKLAEYQKDDWGKEEIEEREKEVIEDLKGFFANYLTT